MSPKNDRIELIVKYTPGYGNVIEVTHDPDVDQPKRIYGFIVPNYDFKHDITHIPAMN